MNTLKYINILISFLLLSVLYLFSCSEESSLVPQPSNVVEGLVKPLSGNAPVSGARVIITSHSDFSDTTTTDAVGYYKFQYVPDGDCSIFFSKGSFSDTLNISVPVAGYAPVARVKPVKHLAFYWGEYDNIQGIIRNMGYSADSLVLTDFYNISKLMQYSIIFINSGISARSELTATAVSDNLRNFLSAGGKIYSSDWAFGCISSIHPELSGTYTGNPVDSLKANVVYIPLSTRLNKNTALISYSTSQWLSLDSTLNQAVNIPYLKSSYGNETDNTMAFFRNEEGGGKLIYTTFHNGIQATVDMINILQYFFFEL